MFISTSLAFSLRDLGVVGLPARRRDAGVETGVEGPATRVAEERLGMSFSSKTALVLLGGKVLFPSFLSGFAAVFGSLLLSHQKSAKKRAL